MVMEKSLEIEYNFFDFYIFWTTSRDSWGLLLAEMIFYIHCISRFMATSIEPSEDDVDPVISIILI